MNKVTAALTQPKETWIGWFASLIEAYNMAIYSFTAPFLAKLLFRDSLDWKALFFSYGLVFISSCLMYPTGAIYYGTLADKKGRQKTCTYSTLGLAVATGTMGLIPFIDYAWIAFLICISAQYFFSGGEYHGSIVFSLEHSKGSQNGVLSSLSCLFAVFGLALANGLAALSLLYDQEIWIRLCFLIGALGGAISYLLKNHCQETPAYSAISSNEDISLFSFLRKEKKAIAGTVLVIALFITIYSYIFIFLPIVDPNLMNMGAFDTFKSLIIYGVFLVIAGFLADRFGIQNVMALGACLLALLFLPLSYWSYNFFALQSILTVCACLLIGPIHSWMLNQFTVKERCRGIFISSAIAISLFGGSTVPLCLLLFETFHSLAICSLYPLALSVSCFVFLRKTACVKSS